MKRMENNFLNFTIQYLASAKLEHKHLDGITGQEFG